MRADVETKLQRDLIIQPSVGAQRLRWVDVADGRGKAVEGHRSPGRCARHDDVGKSRSVLKCASPLAL